MSIIPTFLVLQQDDDGSKIIININDIQYIFDVDNVNTLIHLKSNKDIYVKESVEDIINLLGKGTSIYHVPFWKQDKKNDYKWWQK